MGILENPPLGYPEVLARAKHRDPFVRAVRLDMAQVYRKIRADNPAMARLLFRRIKASELQLNAMLWGRGT